MTLKLFAQPYHPSASGFPFASIEEFETATATLKNAYGQPVEEFEFQFIDGEEIDSALGRAWGLNQVNFGAFIDAVEQWHDYQKIRYIIAVGDCGYNFDPARDHPDDLEVDIYELDSLKELAEQFVEDGLFGSIPESIAHYIDADAIARDLAIEYSEITIAGKRLVYACR